MNFVGYRRRIEKIEKPERKRFAKAIINYAETKCFKNVVDLADDLNINPSTFYAWMKGSNDPDISYLIWLSEKLECSLDYLFGKSDSFTPSLQYIQDKTGLTADAVEKLCFFSDTVLFENTDSFGTFLSKLLTYGIDKNDFQKCYLLQIWKQVALMEYDNLQHRDNDIAKNHTIAGFKAIASQKLLEFIDECVTDRKFRPSHGLNTEIRNVILAIERVTNNYDTKHQNCPIAPKNALGKFKGSLKYMADNFNDPLKEFKEYT